MVGAMQNVPRRLAQARCLIRTHRTGPLTTNQNIVAALVLAHRHTISSVTAEVGVRFHWLDCGNGIGAQKSQALVHLLS